MERHRSPPCGITVPRSKKCRALRRFTLYSAIILTANYIIVSIELFQGRVYFTIVIIRIENNKIYFRMTSSRRKFASNRFRIARGRRVGRRRNPPLHDERRITLSLDIRLNELIAPQAPQAAPGSASSPRPSQRAFAPPRGPGRPRGRAP